jgi:L-ribulose-5-phosphate 3-epimerase
MAGYPGCRWLIPMNRFKLGVVLETTGLPVRTALSTVARLAIHGIQVDAVGDLKPDQMVGTARRDFASRLMNAHLELAALRCPLRKGLDCSENLQARVDHVRNVMQLAYDLGPRCVVLPFPQLAPDETDPRAAVLREVLSDLGRFGDRIGTQLALEPGLDPAEKIRDYLRTFDSGSLRITYDPANFLLNGYDPVAALMSFQGLISIIHGRDGQRRSVSGLAREVPLGAGDLDWLSLIATLEAIDYRGYVIVDREAGTNRWADVTAGVAFLQRFIPVT